MYNILVGKFEGTGHFSCLGVERVAILSEWMFDIFRAGFELQAIHHVDAYWEISASCQGLVQAAVCPSPSAGVATWLKPVRVCFLVDKVTVGHSFSSPRTQVLRIPPPSPKYNSTSGSYSYSFHLTSKASLKTVLSPSAPCSLHLHASHFSRMRYKHCKFGVPIP